jgi:hypothetical protein
VVVESEEDEVRAVALDVHRDFCEVAIVAEGRLRFRAAARRLWRDRTLRRWVVAWAGAPMLAIVNGAARSSCTRTK